MGVIKLLIVRVNLLAYARAICGGREVGQTEIWSSIASGIGTRLQLAASRMDEKRNSTQNQRFFPLRHSGQSLVIR